MSSNNQKNLRVLVADDTESIVVLMKHILTRNGFEVETASDGEQCLEKIGIFKPELVILDIMMPKLHGMDVLKKIKEETHGPGVIICTAKSYKPDLDQAKELGLLVGKGGMYSNALRIAPPLVATKDHVDEALEILDHALARTQEMSF